MMKGRLTVQLRFPAEGIRWIDPQTQQALLPA
jgi:hypothetical protein